MERIDEVLGKLTSIEDSLKKAKLKWYERVLWAIEKALIPIMIAVLAYYGNQAATKIAEGQLTLAESNAHDRKAEFRITMQSKYVEMVYRDITSTDSRQQKLAIGLLKFLDPAIARDVVEFVQSSPQISPTIKDEVRDEVQNLVATAQTPTKLRGSGVLTGYKIGIYYLSADAAAVRTAQSVQAHLKQQGLSNLIALYPSTQAFMERVTPPSSIEVRFEEGIEDRQAQTLVDLLGKQPLARKSAQVPVGSRTPNFVSIFVPSGG